MKRSISQNPKQRARSRRLYFWLIERWGVPSTSSVHTVARSAFTKVQFGAGTWGLAITVKWIPLFGRSRRGTLDEAPANSSPGDSYSNNETQKLQRPHE